MTSRTARKKNQGITLIEIMLVISILVVLATITYPAMGAWKRKASEATCTSRMKRLHIGFESYVQDVGHWPQLPMEIFESNDENQPWKWYHEELEDYEIGPDDWLCPVDQKAILASPPEEQPEYTSSYTPTAFDSSNISPYRWKQPWFMEMGDNHQKGAKVIMPDGQVRYFQNLAVPGGGG